MRRGTPLLLRIYFRQIEMMAINQILEVVFMELMQLFSKLQTLFKRNLENKSTMNAVKKWKSQIPIFLILDPPVKSAAP